MDSKIGSDIAKLLGTLNAKAKDSSAKSTSNADYSASFKQALVASESAQNASGNGKPLPVSDPFPIASRSIQAAVQLASRDLASGASHTTKHALRDFDLVVMGDQSEEAAVISFGKESGMSAEALAQLFAGPHHPVGAERETALAVQNLDAAALYPKLESLGLLGQFRSDIAAALAGSEIGQNKPASSIAEASVQLNQLSVPALERLLKGEEGSALLNLIALDPEAEALPAEWVNKLSAEIEQQFGNANAGILRDLKALLGVPTDSSDTQLSESIAVMVAAPAMTLISEASQGSVFAVSGQSPTSTPSGEALITHIEGVVAGVLKDAALKSSDLTSERANAAEKNIQVVAKELSASLARAIAPELLSLGSLATDQQAVGDRGQSALAVRLAPQVQAWLGQPGVQREISALAQSVSVQPGALSSAIAAQVPQSFETGQPRQATALAQSVSVQPGALSSAIAAQVTQSFETGQLTQATAPSGFAIGNAPMVAEPLAALAASPSVSNASASAALQASVVSDVELQLARSAAVAQPAPLQVSIAGVGTPPGASLAQAATATLVQVQPSTDVASNQTMALAESRVVPNARLATMDRFAMRGVSVKSNQVAAHVTADVALKTGETAKSALETASALRELVISRSATAAAPQQSLPTTTALLSGEGVDTTNAKLVAQAEAGMMRQNVLPGADRTAASDIAKPTYAPGGSNVLARETVGRQLSEALGHRLAANIAAGHYRLTLNVHPKELGAIDVVMEMREGRLDAQISSANAVTRDLLGDSLPRLRDALQQNGIQLANLTIGSDGQQSSGRGGNTEPGLNGERNTTDGLVADTSGEILEDLDLNLDLDTIDFWA